MYTKHDAKMTQGLAILCMLVLHLFCRKGSDVFGTPLIWIDETTPAIYLFGFFAEICVPLYCLTIGYAQELLYEQGQSTQKNRLRRILKLMETYWVVVIMFSVAGLIKGDTLIPGNIFGFLKTLVMLHSYNGAWWFLHSYVLLLLIPPVIILYPVKHLNLHRGGILCVAFTVSLYLLGRFGFRLSGSAKDGVLHFMLTELENLIGILPAVWFGGIMCRHGLLDTTKEWLDKRIPSEKKQKCVFASILAILFFGCYVIHKSVFTSFNAVLVFFIFNLWKKNVATQNALVFLGKHSTNIWLTHMFFYIHLFSGLVQKTKYPLLMLVFILVLCIGCSYLIMGIQKSLRSAYGRLRLLQSHSEEAGVNRE